MAIMIFLSFLIAYPIFMVLVYLTAKVIFSPLDSVVEEQQREKVMLLAKARRPEKRVRRFANA